MKFDLGRWLLFRGNVVERAGAEWTLSCPDCHRDKLAVNVKNGRWQCWVCGFRGVRVRFLVAALAGLPLSDADVIIREYGNALGPVEPLIEQVRSRAARVLPSAPPAPRMTGLTSQSWSYLRERQVAAHTIDALGVRSCAVWGDRVLFPVWTGGSYPVFWTARSSLQTPPTGPKILNLPQPCREEEHPPGCTCNHAKWHLDPTPGVAGKGEVLLGLHLVRPGDRVIIVEGPFDAAVGGYGPDGVFLSSLGSGLSTVQAQLVVASGASEAVILGDGDEAGHRGVWGRDGNSGAVALLGAAIPTSGAVCPPGTDPGRLGREACLRVADAAVRGGHRSVEPLRDAGRQAGNASRPSIPPSLYARPLR